MITAVASFIIYAGAVVALQQHRDNPFFCERVGLAAAVSHVVYRAPLGKVYPSLQKQLLDLHAPVEAVISEAVRLVPSPEDPQTAVNDGNGIGFIVVASWAMRLFGPHLFSLPIFTLGLMGIAVSAFLWRFGDDRAAVVTATFFSLTLMLCTPLVWNPDIAGQIPIGGIRYFSLLAIVPAFHLVLELSDRQRKAIGTTRLHAALLALQVVLLVLAILVRGSAVSLIGPILLAGVFRAWRNRGNPGELRALRGKASVIVAVGAVFLGSLLVTLPPRYVQDGRVTTLFWHRTVISLGTNPAWPFGNLREIYDCTHDIPEGLVAGVVDRNGHCIWWHFAVTHDLPAEVVAAKLYSGQYEGVMRAGFFNIVRLYPREVLATLFYYKPEWIGWSILQDLTPNPASYSPVFNVVVIAGFMNFLGFIVISASLAAGRTMLRLARLGALFGIFSFPSYIVAWATPHTTADLLFYFFFCIALGLGAVMMRTALGRTAAPAEA
jgi:hypothetical protein